MRCKKVFQAAPEFSRPARELQQRLSVAVQSCPPPAARSHPARRFAVVCSRPRGICRQTSPWPPGKWLVRALDLAPREAELIETLAELDCQLGNLDAARRKLFVPRIAVEPLRKSSRLEYIPRRAGFETQDGGSKFVWSVGGCASCSFKRQKARWSAMMAAWPSMHCKARTGLIRKMRGITSLPWAACTSELGDFPAVIETLNLCRLADTGRRAGAGAAGWRLREIEAAWPNLKWRWAARWNSTPNFWPSPPAVGRSFIRKATAGRSRPSTTSAQAGRTIRLPMQVSAGVEQMPADFCGRKRLPPRNA